VSLYYASNDIEQLDRKARERNDHLSSVKDFLSLSQILWAVATYVIAKGGRLILVSNNDGNIPIVVSACQISGPDQLPGVDKLEMLPIIRIYSESDSALDLRSRLLAKGKLGSAELRAFVLSALPLPEELVVD